MKTKLFLICALSCAPYFSGTLHASEQVITLSTAECANLVWPLSDEGLIALSAQAERAADPYFESFPELASEPGAELAIAARSRAFSDYLPPEAVLYYIRRSLTSGLVFRSSGFRIPTPTLFALSHNILGNVPDPRALLSRVAMWMSEDSVLVLEAALLRRESPARNLERYEKAHQADLQRLSRLGITLGSNAEVSLRWEQNEYRTDLIMIQEHTIKMFMQGRDLVITQRLPLGKTIELFRSHRFTREELEDLFSQAGLEIQIFEEAKGRAVITATRAR